jgi:hypothetical protein
MPDNVGNQRQGAALTEPFPWTVIQRVILVLVIISSYRTSKWICLRNSPGWNHGECHYNSHRNPHR